jgi:hypothetical protein
MEKSFVKAELKSHEAETFVKADKQKKLAVYPVEVEEDFEKGQCRECPFKYFSDYDGGDYCISGEDINDGSIKDKNNCPLIIT